MSTGPLARALAYYQAQGMPMLPLAGVNLRQGDDGGLRLGCTCRGGLHCPRPGKHPVCRGGVKAASLDSAQLEAWGSLWRIHGHLGLATGGGRWVLDVDPKHQGDKTLAALVAQHGELPETWWAESGSGGWHFWFAGDVPTGTSRANTSLGLDAIAEAGYVVGPPSKHKSGGAYRWLRWPHQGPLAPAPAWLLEVLFPPPPPPPPRPARPARPARSCREPREPLPPVERARLYLDQRDPAVSGQGGHRATFGTVCRVVRGFDLDESEALSLLSDWNLRCQPPWPERRLREFIHNARTRASYPAIGELL